MTQLRLAWSSNHLENVSPSTTKRFAKCEHSRTTSSKPRSLLNKFEKLQREHPIAAVMIERLVDKALIELSTPPLVHGAPLE